MVHLTPFLLFDATNEKATTFYGSFLGRLGSHQSEGCSGGRSDCALGPRQNHLRSSPGRCHHVFGYRFTEPNEKSEARGYYLQAP